MDKKFNNTPNEFVTKENIGDRGFFISRSVAVVGTILIHHVNTKTTYVLIGKRGKGTPDFQGCWNMPCGYLDWNETGAEALVREVYEETGLDIDELTKSDTACLYNHLEQPWFVNHDSINSNRQNVTLRFGALFLSLQDELPKLTNEHCEPDEVEELKWIDIKEMDQYECAFNHDKVLKEYCTKFNI